MVVYNNWADIVVYKSNRYSCMQIEQMQMFINVIDGGNNNWADVVVYKSSRYSCIQIEQI
jgi:hypothetical protein